MVRLTIYNLIRSRHRSFLRHNRRPPTTFTV